MGDLPLDQLTETLDEQDVAYAGIFGSYARGEETAASDVDILIKFEKPKSLLDIVRLERALGVVLGREVDLVTEASVHPYIRDEVMGQLRVFYGTR